MSAFSRMFSTLGIRTITSFAFVPLSIAGIAFAIHELYENPATAKDNVLLYTFWILAALFILERISSAISDFVADREARTLQHEIDLLPRILATDTDLVTFLHASEARKYCIAVADQAVEIRNTVARYGRHESKRLGTAGSYEGWLAIKRSTLTGGRTVWTELVSAHLSANDPQCQFMIEAEEKQLGYYHERIDDVTTPIINMTIFTFENGVKEAIFGYEYRGMRSTPTFLTRNRYLVEFLEGYFKENLEQARDARLKANAASAV
ncbi:MAG TPA: hypothetical protein VGG48_00935 [Rhizomicrobium sp.]|jgi:hypothetical protein